MWKSILIFLLDQKSVKVLEKKLEELCKNAESKVTELRGELSAMAHGGNNVFLGSPKVRLLISDAPRVVSSSVHPRLISRQWDFFTDENEVVKQPL